MQRHQRHDLGGEQAEALRWLGGLVNMDDAYIGGERPGEAGRGGGSKNEVSSPRLGAQIDASQSSNY